MANSNARLKAVQDHMRDLDEIGSQELVIRFDMRKLSEERILLDHRRNKVLAQLVYLDVDITEPQFASLTK